MVNSYISITIFILFSIEKLIAFSNLTDFINLRQKRSIIYQGGAVKFSVAGIWPLYLEDPVNWRQMNCLAGLQTQYELPSKPRDTFFNKNWGVPYERNLKTIRDEFDRFSSIKPDFSRVFVYTALEEFMNRNGRNGRECLLRSICENAQIDEHVDDFSRILDVILTPGRDDLDEVYREAFKAGEFGADCLTSYSKCSYGDSFLDRIAVVT
ncbi:uncharacterized protein LOC129915021 [Episyrphus balteatus]|uniref:uncharacterized protein LOC129915021 n=1 Tax=Episyrphus balteatus TaxID=286459 RepID=UPI0024856DCD|nr:uncharacterized protein LOC129915021 [Episyrphus balteatus]